ncbi:MAG TPA: hypothetical protein VIN03_20625, partial [Roseateles sp.]
MESQGSQRRVRGSGAGTGETDAAATWPPAQHAGSTEARHLVIGLRSLRADEAGAVSWVLMRSSAQDCRHLEATLAGPVRQVALRPYRVHVPGAPTRTIRWTLRLLRHELVAVVGLSRSGHELYRSMPMPADRFLGMASAEGGPTGPFEMQHDRVMFFDAQPQALRDSFDRHLADRTPASMHRRRAPRPPRRAEQRATVARVARLTSARRKNTPLPTGLHRSALSATVCAALATTVPARHSFAATYTTSITGNTATDSAYSTSVSA